MTPRRRLVTGALLAAGVLACASAAPQLLRRVEAFRVRHVEITGTRFLDPAEVLAATGIGPASSVFDDPEPWRAALLAHPLVAEAWIGRKPPATLGIHVRETEPVALVRTPTLRPVDARGRVLPVDPADGALDLPILAGAPKLADGSIPDERTVAALAGLAELRALQPSLWAWVSEVHADRSDLRLVLRWPPDAELLLALPVDVARLEEVRLVLAELATAGAGADGSLAGAAAGATDLTRLHRLDARFRDQVVVALRTPGRTQRGAGN